MRQVFIDKWKYHITGMALFGVASESQDGVLGRARKIHETPARVEELLGRMYDELLAMPVGDLADVLVAKLDKAVEADKKVVIDKMRAALSRGTK